MATCDDLTSSGLQRGRSSEVKVTMKETFTSCWPIFCHNTHLIKGLFQPNHQNNFFPLGLLVHHQFIDDALIFYILKYNLNTVW